MEVKIQIQNGSRGIEPVVKENIVWETERRGSPGKLTFSCINDGNLIIEEGNAVKLIVDGTPMFYGYVFKINRDKSKTIDILCYDQMRYLKNKDTYNFSNTTANRIIGMVAKDYGIVTGELEETTYLIKSWVAEDKTLFDIMQESLDMTLTNTRQLYILYDDVGKLTLKRAQRMVVGLIIDSETAETYKYESDIDKETYNRVLLVYEDSETKGRTYYKAEGSQTEWGTLQYYEKISDNANAQNKANALLKLYNTKTKHLTITNALGDKRVRAGSVILVRLDLGDMKVDNLMLVNKCKHIFKNNEHFMTLSVIGGGFVG